MPNTVTNNPKTNFNNPVTDEEKPEKSKSWLKASKKEKVKSSITSGKTTEDIKTENPPLAITVVGLKKFAPLNPPVVRDKVMIMGDIISTSFDRFCIVFPVISKHLYISFNMIKPIINTNIKEVTFDSSSERTNPLPLFKILNISTIATIKNISGKNPFIF